MNQVPGGPDGRPEPSRDLTQGKPAPISGQAPRPDWRLYARVFIWVVVAVIAVLFLVRNSTSVSVDFVFFVVTVPLFVALIVALALGMLLGGTAAWWSARRRRKAASAEARGK